MSTSTETTITPPELHAGSLREFLAALCENSHHIYAFLSGLSKEFFHIARVFDVASNRDLTEGDEDNTYTIPEFIAGQNDFHEKDPFLLYFFIRHAGEEEHDQFTEIIEICYEHLLIIEDVFHDFLRLYCEQCLREDNPFVLTPSIITHFGFTENDVELMEHLVSMNNVDAIAKIQAERNKIESLSFIRN